MACQEAGNCVPSVDVEFELARDSEHLHCTVDGSTPTQASPLCDDGLQIEQTGTIIKAIVFGKTVEPSEILVSQPIVVACYPPVFEPLGGTFTDNTIVTIMPSQTNSKVYFTLDGT
ncbi:MAG: chitobiase/beta-hexosaminidase C-terminal domain-containing protein, partial [bacterium]